MTTHALELGSLDLVGGLPHDDGYTIKVIGAGATFGESQASVREIVSMLADGNHVRYDRAGNRVVSFDVLVTGADGVALQAGEVALRRELYGPNLLTWTPPSDFSAPTVFEVITSEMAPRFDDIDELRNRRVFRVTLTCAPFARSAELVTIPASDVPVTPTTVTVNNADTTTGWSATKTDNNGIATTVTPTDGGAYVVATTSGIRYQLDVRLAVTPVVVTATPLLQVEMSGDAPTHFYVTLDGVEQLVAPELARATPSGTVVYLLRMPGVSLSGLRVRRTRSEYASLSTTLNVHDVSRTNMVPQVSPRQVTRVIEVGGTERTPGSVHLKTASGTGSLGMAVIHTCPEDGSGYSPPLQRWRTVGQTRTTDTTAFSGTYETVNVTSWAAEVPTYALPEGGYSLVARMRAQTAATVLISWSTSTIFPDATTQQGFTLGKTSHPFAVGNEWDIVPLTVLSLPSVRTKAGKVQIAIQVEAASPVVTLDEAWLFREGDDCATSIVKTARPHLWLDSADISSPVPLVWVGDGDATKVHPGEGLVAQGTHVLSPDGTAVFTAALTDNPATEATFYRRWHSNAAE